MTISRQGADREIGAGEPRVARHVQHHRQHADDGRRVQRLDPPDARADRIAGPKQTAEREHRIAEPRELAVVGEPVPPERDEPRHDRERAGDAAAVSGSLRIKRLPSVEQSSMQLGVMTPMWPPGANASPPAVSNTYGAPAPHARNNAGSGRSAPSRRRANNGSSSNPATPNRSAVTSHASSALLAIDSFVMAGKPPQISAANAPNAAPASGEAADEGGSLIGEPLVDAALETLQRARWRPRRRTADTASATRRRCRAPGSIQNSVLKIPAQLMLPGERANGSLCGAVICEAQAEFVAAGAERERLAERGQRRRLLLDEHGTDVVLAHQRDGRFAQQAHAVRRAARCSETAG